MKVYAVERKTKIATVGLMLPKCIPSEGGQTFDNLIEIITEDEMKFILSRREYLQLGKPQIEDNVKYTIQVEG